MGVHRAAATSVVLIRFGLLVGASAPMVPALGGGEGLRDVLLITTAEGG